MVNSSYPVSESSFRSKITFSWIFKLTSRVVKIGQSKGSGTVLFCWAFLYLNEGRWPPNALPAVLATAIWRWGFKCLSNVPVIDVTSNGPLTLVKNALVPNLIWQCCTLPVAVDIVIALWGCWESNYVRVVIISWPGWSLPT